jgi:hypothetical protein
MLLSEFVPNCSGGPCSRSSIAYHHSRWEWRQNSPERFGQPLKISQAPDSKQPFSCRFSHAVRPNKFRCAGLSGATTLAGFLRAARMQAGVPVFQSSMILHRLQGASCSKPARTFGQLSERAIPVKIEAASEDCTPLTGAARTLEGHRGKPGGLWCLSHAEKQRRRHRAKPGQVALRTGVLRSRRPASSTCRARRRE